MGRVQLPPAVSYSIRRIALFLATLALAAASLRGVNFFAVILVATLVSGVLSYVLLSGPREQMARSVSGRVGRLSARIDASAAREDAALDAPEAARPAPEQ
jgi:outer membrane murein-binding lipoprotein Lpp